MHESSTDTEVHEAGLRGLIAALRRRLAVLLLACVGTVCAATILTASAEPTYEASAALLFRDSGLVRSGSTPPSEDPLRAAETDRNLLLLDSIAAAASKQINGRRTPDEVRAQISVEGDLNSDLVRLRVEDPDPDLAVELANAYAEAAVAFRREGARASVRSAQRSVLRELDLLRSIPAPIESQRLRIRTLEATLAELQGAEHLATGNLQLVERAMVATEAGLGLVATAMLACFGGLLLGMVGALLLEQFDRRIKNSDEVGNAMALPLLGSVPRSRALAGSFSRTLPPRETEAFRLLDVNLRYLDSGHPIRSLLLTSVGTNEGKTTIALHLARTWADAGYNVLLIEADFRKGSLSHAFGLPTERGLSDYLAGNGDLSGFWHSVPVTAREVGAGVFTADVEGAGGRAFHCITAGTPSSNPLRLLASPRMQWALRKAEERFDAVIIDAPPAGAVADAMPLLRMVGGVLVVTRLGSVTHDGLEELRRKLEVSGARLLGVVANAVERKRNDSVNSYVEKG